MNSDQQGRPLETDDLDLDLDVDPAEQVGDDDFDPDLDLDSDPDDESAGQGSLVADRVQALLEPVLPTVGVELIDVEWTGGSLRVVVDREEGIATDTLAETNRLISPILDQHDPVPGRYTLEVSSPGVERPLRRLHHYERAVSETVVIKTVSGVEPRRIKGVLQTVDDGQLTIEANEIDGVDLVEVETTVVAMSDVATAKTVFDWGPTPKQPVANRKPHPDKPQSQRKAKGKKGKSQGGKPQGKRSANQKQNQKQNTNKEGRP